MTFLHILLLVISAFSVATCASAVPPARQADSFVLRNVNVVDVANQRIIPDQTIWVKNGVISAVRSEHLPAALTDHPAKTHPEVPVYDGKGGYVTPGLIDMHTHIYEPAAYLMTLSHGVTHVRIMNGVPNQLLWRDKVAAGEMIGSTSTVSSPIISGYQGTLLHHGVSSAKAAQQAVIQYHERGYDLIKAYGNLNEQALTALVEQANALNMPVAKHGPHASGNMPVSSLRGLQSFEHVEDIYQGSLNFQMNDKALGQVISDIKQTDVPVTPTLNIFYQLTQLSAEKEAYLAISSPEYTPDIIALEAKQNQVKRWLDASEKMAAHNRQTLDFLMLVTKKLHEANVELLVGSDSGVLLSPHGIAAHTEMKLMQQAGLSAYAVLAAATVNPAKALQQENKLGKISANFQADFIFTEGNPVNDLSVLAQPVAVSKLGRWYTQAELIALRNAAIKQRSIWRELYTLFEAM